MKLRDVLKTEEQWTKGAFARNANGEPVDTDSGVCFCISGAILKCFPFSDTYSKICDVIKQNYRHRIGYPTDVVTYFNDHPETTFDDVCKVIELAGV